ncbi:MAG: hypothetical protein IJU41_01430 [Clostridia bacterium]|nr:hypothetical protein [Clostridia bacterium]
MAKDKMVYFRTALGGFNKEDVNRYIERINADIAERERTLQKKLTAAESKAAELEEISAKYTDALAKIEELGVKADEREALIAEQLAALDQSRMELESLTEKYNAALSRQSELESQFDAFSEAVQKSEKYDGVRAEIGDIILSAKSSAEEIIRRANRDADEIKANANQRMEQALASFNARTANASTAIKEHMKKLADSVYAQMAVETEKAEAALRSLSAQVEYSRENIDNMMRGDKLTIEKIAADEAAKIFTEEHRLK